MSEFGLILLVRKPEFGLILLVRKPEFGLILLVRKPEFGLILLVRKPECMNQGCSKVGLRFMTFFSNLLSMLVVLLSHFYRKMMHISSYKSR